MAAAEGRSRARGEDRAVTEFLRVDAVTKCFGGLAAVRNVSFSVRRGEIVGLIGPNGAGKTTMFNMLVGLVRPTSGSVTFEGREIHRLPPHRIAALGVTKTFQTITLFDELRPVENVIVAALLRSGRAPTATARSVMNLVGLNPDAVTTAGELTLVDRARLEVARALATDPRLLLLDEVMVGLTPNETQNAMSIIRATRERGVTVIVVEHNMRAIMAISDRIIAFDHGQLIADGTPEAVARTPAVVESYLGRGYGAAQR
jgi:branched-chain amino acid transport system ATP-binding protein